MSPHPNGLQQPPEHTFDEAITLAGNGRFQLVVLIVCATALMASISEGLNMAFVLPIARCDLAISVQQQGIINAIGFIGVIVTSHMWGFLADTWGRQRALRLSLGLTFVSCTLSSLSFTSTMLLVTRLAVGTSISGVQAAGISYMGEFHNNRRRSRYVTFAVAGMSVSIILQSLLALAILPMDWSYSFIGLDYVPWRLFLLCNGCIIGAAFAVMLFLPESPKFLLVTGRPAEALHVLRLVHRWNSPVTGEGSVTGVFAVNRLRVPASDASSGTQLKDARTPAAVLQLMWSQTWPLFTRPYVGRMVALSFVSWALFVVAHGLYLWLPQILDIYYERADESITFCEAIGNGVAVNGTQHFSSTNDAVTAENVYAAASTICTVADRNPLTYIITTANGVCFTAMFVAAALTINRVGNRNLIVTWLLICTAATLALLWNNRFETNCVLFMLLNSSAPAGSLITAAAADFFPTQHKAMALCLILMACRIGSICGSNLVGALLFDNCTILIGVDVALLAVATLTYFCMFGFKGSSSSEH